MSNSMYLRMKSLYRISGKHTLFLEAVSIEHKGNGRVIAFVKDMLDGTYTMLPSLTGHPGRDFKIGIEQYEKNGWRECSQASYEVDGNDEEDIYALRSELVSQLKIDSDDEIDRLMKLIGDMITLPIGDDEVVPVEKSSPVKIATKSELLGSW